MNTIYQENTTSKAKIKRESQRNRTREENSKLFNRRWSKTKIKEIKALNEGYPPRNSFQFLLNPFSTTSNISEPKKNNINIYITPVYARTRTRVLPKSEKTKQKTIKAENLRPKRDIKDVPSDIANLPFKKLVQEIDRIFAGRYTMKTLGKLRVFGEEALKYALWAYKKYPHHKLRHELTFDYFFVTAKNFSEDNSIKLLWKENYYSTSNHGQSMNIH